MRHCLQKQWTAYTVWHVLLLPIAALFGLISALRRFLYKVKVLKSYRLAVPVVVVGNIHIGGTGKTPLVIWLAQQLTEAGYVPGIISRGYGGSAQHPMKVTGATDPVLVGDEPVLIAMHTDCPVFVGADRIRAGQQLLSEFPGCNVLISDDGLQHYRMQRDVEIVVYDAEKAFGNGLLLPAGPLRETTARLKTVDAVVCNGVAKTASVAKRTYHMQLLAGNFYNLKQVSNQVTAAAFVGKKILAVAGIGNPARFFNQLTQMGLQFERRAFADHYAYSLDDFNVTAADIVVMTEKDAVKCKLFAQENFWVLPVSAVIENDLMPIILNKLNQ